MPKNNNLAKVGGDNQRNSLRENLNWFIGKLHQGGVGAFQKNHLMSAKDIMWCLDKWDEQDTKAK